MVRCPAVPVLPSPWMWSGAGWPIRQTSTPSYAPGFEQPGLPRASLLGGRAEDAHAAGDAALFEDGGGAQEADQGGDGDEVVAAGMQRARVGKGEAVVLGVKDDQMAARPEFGLIAGVEAVGMRGDGEALGAQELDLGVMREDFFVAELGIFPDLGLLASLQRQRRWMDCIRTVRLIRFRSSSTWAMRASMMFLTWTSSGLGTGRSLAMVSG